MDCYTASLQLPFPLHLARNVERFTVQPLMRHCACDETKPVGMVTLARWRLRHYMRCVDIWEIQSDSIVQSKSPFSPSSPTPIKLASQCNTVGWRVIHSQLISLTRKTRYTRNFVGGWVRAIATNKNSSLFIDRWTARIRKQCRVFMSCLASVVTNDLNVQSTGRANTLHVSPNNYEHL